MKLSQFAFLDSQMRWKVEAGEMEVLAGASAGDIRFLSNVIRGWTARQEASMEVWKLQTE